MAIQAQDYLGTWVDLEADESTAANMECTSVDIPTLTAVFDNGRRISVIDLDTSGRYEKVKPWFSNPQVASEMNAMGHHKKPLSEQAVQSQVLGDLSKIGHRKVESTGYSQVVDSNPTPEPVGTSTSASTISPEEARIAADPVANFIDSAIQISRKTGKKTVIPVTIPLEIDFDIINVIQMSMQIGASDIEILQHIMRYIQVPESMVKQLITQELMSPADAAIVNEHREEQFEETLKEELEKADNPEENANQDVPDSEFHELT